MKVTYLYFRELFTTIPVVIELAGDGPLLEECDCVLLLQVPQELRPGHAVSNQAEQPAKFF